jgi:hypothetical protein
LQTSPSRAAAARHRPLPVVRAQIVKTIRPDTVFVPYHWPLDRSAQKAEPTGDIATLDPSGWREPVNELAFFIDNSLRR